MRVDFTIPPVLNQIVKQPATLTYVVFFAVGMFSGTVMTAGTGNKSGRAKSAMAVVKPEKVDIGRSPFMRVSLNPKSLHLVHAFAIHTNVPTGSLS